MPPTDKELADWISGRSAFCPICGNAHDGSYLCPVLTEPADAETFARVRRELGGSE